MTLSSTPILPSSINSRSSLSSVQDEILSSASSGKKVVRLLPWDSYRSNLSLRSTVCFALSILTCLGMIALMSYALLYDNWSLFGISLGIIVLLISVALILNFPVKNKMFGISLTSEISQDISDLGRESITKCSAAFTNIRNTFLPHMRDLHSRFDENGYDKIISEKEAQIAALSSNLDSIVAERRQELAAEKERSPNSARTRSLEEQLSLWDCFEQDQ
ncbi:hypothetical protein [Chlamydia vaughanii]|uniref:hypothetical protein n=1 Tax=Chlamydia vaughanii TaxID=3112552 RepID=UPI0032B2CC89